MALVPPTDVINQMLVLDFSGARMKDVLDSTTARGISRWLRWSHSAWNMANIRLR